MLSSIQNATNTKTSQVGFGALSGAIAEILIQDAKGDIPTLRNIRILASLANKNSKLHVIADNFTKNGEPVCGISIYYPTTRERISSRTSRSFESTLELVKEAAQTIGARKSLINALDRLARNSQIKPTKKIRQSAETLKAQIKNLTIDY